MEKNLVEEEINYIQYVIRELRDSYELHNKKWAEIILNNIEKSIENILKEYKELKEIANTPMGNIRIANKEDYIPKSKVREIMEQDIKTNEHTILGGRRIGKTLEYGRRLGRIEMCEELLQEGDK